MLINPEAAWLVGALALALLVFVSWRRSIRPAIRAVLAVSASACLSLILTNGNPLALALLALDVVLLVATWLLAQRPLMQSRWGIAWIAVLIITLGIAKLPSINTTALISAPTAWIGISYFMFRLLHVALDARRGRLGDATLAETVVYALHPTTLLAGPIDRLQHHVAEQRCEPKEPQTYVAEGLWRLFIGIFKKVAVVGLLYSVMTAHDFMLVTGMGRADIVVWLVAYGFYLYMDFAGYSDIAIGAARLMGLRLPDNFANPYLQPNIARFWQSWHITLSNWLRDYIFFPLSRMLLKRFGSRFSAPILLLSHVTTMAICGLWHGLSGGFLAWGIWHGLGLFAFSQMPTLRQRVPLPAMPRALSTTVTFVFITLGWIFFTHGWVNSLRVFARLLGGQ